jgi:hypothetical protein
MSVTDVKTTRTDSRHRAILPGPVGQLYQVTEHSDGTLTLVPARVVSEAQHEYDNSPELQALLSEALASPSVHYEW